MSSFEKSLRHGQAGESAIAMWLRGRGLNVLPVYEKQINSGKGPTVFAARGPARVAPDLLAFKDGEAFWFEAKRKSAFTWYRIGRAWTTGIDQRHFHEYLYVQELNPNWPVWLLFLHERGNLAVDTPKGLVSPSGLYGGELVRLSQNYSHKSSRWGSSGMIYWREDQLQKIAPIEEFDRFLGAH